VFLPPRNLPAHVRTDEKRLRQILVNLLSNAVKYTPSGSVTLTVRYQGLIADFDIADTGIGIAPEDLTCIFEPFNRGSSGQALTQSGTGLGLAITRMLAQVMGGDVSVESTVGTGSVFRLRVMLPEASGVVPATVPQGRVTGYAGPHRTLLLVDDDPAQLHALRGLLQPLGFKVYTASSGAEGLDLAKRCSPDLVLLDIQLGDLTGWDVVRQLRALHVAGKLRPDGDTMKIVMVSANAHEFAGGADRNAGHDGFVPKPVQFDALLDAIATQLGLSWQFQSVGSTADAGLPLPGLAAPAHRIDRLRYLGQIGHVRGIEVELDALATEFPASAPLVEQLRCHVRSLDLNAYLGLLDRHG
jgi:CheY-like chemotaxis protein